MSFDENADASVAKQIEITLKPWAELMEDSSD